jgi:MIP family channel proteins
MVFATGHISGAHINPAVTIAFWSVGRFPRREVPFYVVAQLLGACVGSAAIRCLIGDYANLGATIPAGSVGQSLGIEFLLTFLLMFVIMAVATDTRSNGAMAAIAIGTVVGLGAMFAGPISGASMNPARSFGPAFIGGYFSAHWIYWIGPIAGSVFAAWIYDAIRCDPNVKRVSVKGCC